MHSAPKFSHHPHHPHQSHHPHHNPINLTPIFNHLIPITIDLTILYPFNQVYLSFNSFISRISCEDSLYLHFFFNIQNVILISFKLVS